MRMASPTATAIVTISSTSELRGDFFFLRDTDIWAELEEADPIGGPVGEECLADQPPPGNRSPVAAVERVGAIVAHHVVIALGDGDRGTEVALADVPAGQRER